MPPHQEPLRCEIEANQKLSSLLDDVFSGVRPEEARELLRLAAARWEDDCAKDAAEALRFYNGMKSALSEEDFRWCAIASPFLDRRQLRKARLAQYNRHRELFELEIGLALRIRRSAIALSGDWSQLEEYCREALRMARAKGMLWLAGRLFRLRVPGAVDLCDAAAFLMVSSAYLAA